MIVYISDVGVSESALPSECCTIGVVKYNTSMISCRFSNQLAPLATHHTIVLGTYDGVEKDITSKM